jgi:hypothetical protein
MKTLKKAFNWMGVTLPIFFAVILLTNNFNWLFRFERPPVNASVSHLGELCVFP